MKDSTPHERQHMNSVFLIQNSINYNSKNMQLQQIIAASKNSRCSNNQRELRLSLYGPKWFCGVEFVLCCILGMQKGVSGCTKKGMLGKRDMVEVDLHLCCGGVLNLKDAGSSPCSAMSLLDGFVPVTISQSPSAPQGSCGDTRRGETMYTTLRSLEEHHYSSSWVIQERWQDQLYFITSKCVPMLRE